MVSGCGTLDRPAADRDCDVKCAMLGLASAVQNQNLQGQHHE
jgi:hypothetical protein